jgi:hypothetical protein
VAATAFIVRVESSTAVATLRLRTAQHAVHTAHDYLRMGAATVTIETPAGELIGIDRFDELMRRRSW